MNEQSSEKLHQIATVMGNVIDDIQLLAKQEWKYLKATTGEEVRRVAKSSIYAVAAGMMLIAGLILAVMAMVNLGVAIGLSFWVSCAITSFILCSVGAYCWNKAKGVGFYI